MAFGLLLLFIAGTTFVAYFIIPKIVESHRKESIRSTIQRYEILDENENVLGKFQYTPQEWNYTLSEECIGDKYKVPVLTETGFKRYKNFNVPERDPKIYFFREKIIISNSQYYLIYSFDTANEKGYGIHLLSMKLRERKPLDILEIETLIVYMDDDGRAEREENLTIPIPKSAISKIDHLLVAYGHGVLPRTFDQNIQTNKPSLPNRTEKIKTPKNLKAKNTPFKKNQIPKGVPYYCLYCQYSSPRKLFECPECGRNKFAYEENGLFHCVKCQHCSENLFERCPQCTGSKKPQDQTETFTYSNAVVSEEKLISDSSSFNSFDVKPRSYTPERQKICADCSAQNDRLNRGCKACGSYNFIDPHEMKKIRTEGVKEIKQCILLGLGILIIVPIILFSIDITELIKTLPYVLYGFFGFILIILASTSAHAYYKFAYGTVHPILEKIYKYLWVPAIIIYLLAEIFN
jgi:hypothetical protein